MAKFAKGAQVRQIVTPIEGEVAGFSVDQETGNVLVLVKWGDGHSRYFTEAELEAKPEAP